MINTQIRKLLLAPNTPATVLLVLASDCLGPKFVAWDPQTISMEMEEALGQQLPPPCFNRLMAAVELVTSDAFYVSLPDFIRVCNVLYNGSFDPTVFDPADAVEIAWGLTEAILIWPPAPNDEEPFAQKILQYIGAVLRDEGILIPPDILRLGLGDSQDWAQVQMEFSDDPLMFNAIYDKETAKTDEINVIVKDRLRAVLEALEALQLKDGDAEDAVKQLLIGLRRAEQRSDELKPA